MDTGHQTQDATKSDICEDWNIDIDDSETMSKKHYEVKLKSFLQRDFENKGKFSKLDVYFNFKTLNKLAKCDLRGH